MTNILSLFDGMSCCQLALNRAGIHYDNYYASEVDKYAIKVTMENYPNTIQLGDVRNVYGESLPPIWLLAGGSPCQSFSFAGKRKGMSTKDEQEILTLEHYLQLKAEDYEFEGQSYLFWEYMRILNEVKPKYFLLENVLMGKKWQKILTDAIGVEPVMINSSLVSAQNRKRLYWTNIGAIQDGLFGKMISGIKQPQDKNIMLKDVLQDNPNSIYYLTDEQTKRVLNRTQVDINGHDEPKAFDVYNKKIKEDGKSPSLLDPIHNSLRLIEPIPIDDKYYLSDKMLENMRLHENKNGVIGHSGTGGQKGLIFDTNARTGALCATDYKQPKQILTGRIRRLTPMECERLQTVPDGYTAHVSDTQRYKMLGNGWTIDVISHIFSHIQND